MRERDGENAMIRWRQYEMSIALSPSYYRTVAIVLPHSCIAIIVLSRSHILAIAFSHSRHCIVALSSTYCRILVIVLSRFRILTTGF
ncbi:hypothetical protein DPMN_004098 [Dreissena polymorpha]|uniref:Uncharacterized protein n=1 Tax=Dreissena polymorpha TaxID=45954 RepID=A0A9D4MMZ9_DREPO|nr:hypothetical protein DPMN_004098 [Dreissena polymorpha]